jgi:lipopolysaccharide/colanic/teichoic acid biosynthesis glycosyltransferase
MRVKRFFDIVMCLFALPMALTIMAAIALAIWATSGPPVLHRAIRAGRFGRPFTILKFRTMVTGTVGPAVTSRTDPRVTALGKILRRTKLDELPQVINVFKGEMSLVGPRPEDPKFLAWYTDEERQVLTVAPGMTSLAVLYYPHEEQLLKDGDREVESRYVADIMHQKLDLDLYYVRHRSMALDLRILVCTVGALLGFGERAGHHC